MDLRLNTNGQGNTYGSISYTSETTFQNTHSLSFSPKSNKVSPVNDFSEVSLSPEESPSTLNISDVTYVVREYVGPWWNGACFRKTRRKTVLQNISLQVKSGEITAILGNSGM
jgi:ABC-type glutathione transport system ATPase component